MNHQHSSMQMNKTTKDNTKADISILDADRGFDSRNVNKSIIETAGKSPSSNSHHLLCFGKVVDSS